MAELNGKLNWLGEPFIFLQTRDEKKAKKCQRWMEKLAIQFNSIETSE